MAWEQWILPAVLLGGMGALYYLIAKKGISCCGSTMSSGHSMGEETQEPRRHAAKLQRPDDHVNIAPETPAEPTHLRIGTLAGKASGNSDEG